ncbi:MAG: pyridoxamine 5'-phosphate oxidase family protein [Roseobacter sp.]
MVLLTSRDPKPTRDVWHAGEKQMQNALGVADKMRNRGAVVIRDFMPDQHRAFFADQRFVVLSALDANGQPWAFLRTGPQGFMSSPSAEQLCITSRPTVFERPDLRLKARAKISVLGIEFETKRRNRLNGTISQVQGDRMTVTVDQSFGNCPRYIHARDHLTTVERRPELSEGPHLTDTDIAQITSADALFIASRAPDIGDDRRAGVDINHRGGLPGFVQVTKDRTLVVPDYDGNKFFNTIGNILLDPRVSLMFFDFDAGNVITLAGTARVNMDTAKMAAEYGVQRVIHVAPNHVTRAKAALPFTSKLRSLSRDAPMLGTVEVDQ